MLDCKWYALKMIRRYFDLKVEINQLDAGEVLHATTEARLQELGDMLQDCVTLIFFIEGSRYVTLSCVPFALHYLLQHPEPKRGDDASIAISRSILRNYVVEKYPIYPVHYLLPILIHDSRIWNLLFNQRSMLQNFMTLQNYWKIKYTHYAIISHIPLQMFQSSDKNLLRSLQEKKSKINILQKMRADHSGAALHASQASVLSVDDALKEEMHRYIVYCK